MEVGSTEIKNTYTKWLEDGRFFLLPNAIFTLGLSPGEMTLYAYLIFCEDRKTHQCWPSIGRISQVRNGTLQFTIRPIQDAVNYKLENDLSTLPDPKHTRKRR